MDSIKERFKVKADLLGAEIKQMIKEHGNKVIGEVTLSQIYQGMRGMTGLVSETSLLDANEGIRFRGYSIPELKEKLPAVEGGSEPLPEGLFHLMLLGELPTQEEADTITATLQRRSHVPNYVFDTIEALPVIIPSDDHVCSGHHGLAEWKSFCQSVRVWHEQKRLLGCDF